MAVTTRAELATYMAGLGFKSGAEIGVLTGDFAKVLCQTIPELKYFGIDPWDTGARSHFHRGHYEETLQKLSGFKATLIKKPSLEAVADFADSSLDFVYIDGDHHFDFVILDIIAWAKKVKKGGIIAGHDYNPGNSCGVIPAVNGYVEAHHLSLNLTTDPNEATTWWFVKKWNT